jgi:single-strand DNA-binding protein
MAGETITTVIGNLTAEPELRFTPSGAAVASFTVASTPRTFKNGQWEDGEALFLRCNAWRQMAENAAESLTRGTRVIVQGRLKQRSFETREGEKRTVVELDVDEIGASIKFKQVTVREAERSGGTQQPQQQRPQQPPDDPWSPPAPARPQQPVQQGFDQNDPWGSAPRQPAGGGYDDPPPF